jgi:hypothetical protein
VDGQPYTGAISQRAQVLKIFLFSAFAAPNKIIVEGVAPTY